MRDMRRKSEAGMALVLAMLSLMLLTFLGLALAATTSTELQIANNYRWSLQAFYNAEAGVEIAKKTLGTIDWATALPAVRTSGGVPETWYGFEGSPGDTGPLDPADTIASGSRDYENYICDWRGHGMGYGRVLNDGTISYLNVSSGDAVRGQALRGAFTVWVRRPVEPSPDTALFSDKTGSDDIVITAEGVAPYVGGVSTLMAQQNQALRTMEVLVSKASLETSCGSRAGQTGGGSEGSGFSQCFAIDPASIGAALGLAAPDADDTVR